MKKLFGNSKKNSSDAPDPKAPKAVSKGGSFTVGDLLMSLAMLALAVGTYFGYCLLYGDKLMAFVVALCVTVAASVLLFFAIKAKTQTNNRTLWLIVESVCVAVLIVGVLFGTSFLRHFEYVYANKGQVQEAFNEDATTMANLFAKYEKSEGGDIGIIAENIKDLPPYEILKTDDETKARWEIWKTDHNLKHRGAYTPEQLNAAAASYTALLNKELLETSYNIHRNTIQKRMKQVKEVIDANDGFSDYISQSQKVKQIFKDAASGLNKLSNSDIKYRVYSNGSVIKSEKLSRDYTNEVDTETLAMAKVLSGTAKSTGRGWALSALIVLLILCAYLAAPRSRRVLALSKQGRGMMDPGVKLFQ